MVAKDSKIQELEALCRRLRLHADSIENLAARQMAADMEMAAKVITSFLEGHSII